MDPKMKKLIAVPNTFTALPVGQKLTMSVALMRAFVLTRCSGGDLWGEIQMCGPVSILAAFRAYAGRRSGASPAVIEVGCCELMDEMEATAQANGYDLLMEYGALSLFDQSSFGGGEESAAGE